MITNYLKTVLRKASLLICGLCFSLLCFGQKVEWVVEPTLEFDDVEEFSEGLALVTKKDNNGFVDKTGRTIIPLKYSRAESFSEGLARVRNNDLWGFIDKRGNIIVPLTYDFSGDFSEGLAFVSKQHQYGFIDTNGKVIIPLKYDDADAFSDGLARVAKNQKYGFINQMGNIIIALEYDYIGSFHEGLAEVKKNDKWGFVDKTGEIVIPLEFESVDSFSNGLASVKKNEKWGFIDKTGEVIIPLEYNDVKSFSEGLTRVKKNEQWSLITKTGKVISNFEYDWSRTFAEELLSVHKNYRWGYINKQGKEILPLQFESAYSFSEGLAWVKKDGKWGIIKNPLQKNQEPEYITIDKDWKVRKDSLPPNVTIKSLKILRRDNIYQFQNEFKADDKTRGLTYYCVGINGNCGLNFNAVNLVFEPNERLTAVSATYTVDKNLPDRFFMTYRMTFCEYDKATKVCKNDKIITTYDWQPYRITYCGDGVVQIEDGENCDDKSNECVNCTKKEAPKPTDTQAPAITITSPKNAQERSVGKLIFTSPTLTLQGQITDNEKVTTAWLNGQVLALQADGSFSQSVPLNMGTNSLLVEATDAAQNRGTFRFEVERRAEATVSTAFGTYHALLIAAKDYKDPSVSDLTFPVSDAQKLKEVLQNKYAFAPQNVKFLSNPTRSELLAALGRCSEQLTDKDNLLIFYAGHGEWDARLRQGYWLLADANANERGNWFSNADLKTYLGGISTKHTLLISDACFSGSIFQGRSNAPNRAVTALAGTPSRRAMTSGTLKTVPDESVFMRYLLKRLNENSEPYLSAQSLFSSFREAVINNLPAGSNLIPQYGIVQEAGDEGGDFVFVKK